jgi:hypothetical protein
MINKDKRVFCYKQEVFSSNFVVQYKNFDNSKINQLCDKYGSDKGEVNSENNPYRWPSHNHADVYDMLFRLKKNSVNLVVECGIGTNNPKIKSSMGINGKPGASLRVWRDFFPNARIIGIDIDRDILFLDHRIETFYCDQTNETDIFRFVNDAGIIDNTIDIIIDDGLHNFEAGKVFFEGMINYMSNDGIYVIEDVNHDSLIKYKDYFSQNTEKYTAYFFDLNRPNLVMEDNRLVVIFKN